MTFTPTSLPGSFVIGLEPLTDERGWFTRYFCQREFNAIGHSKEWVQMNHSMSIRKATIRGMHFQVAPFREIKLVRCVHGAVFDVIVDLRKGSDTFLKWFGAELSAENKKMIYIPEGFAHGFQCLSDDCELLYHHTEFYQPGFEAGIRYDDPLLGIDWPLPVTIVSGKDQSHQLLTPDFKGL
jgi:dTDP-4-dehydrorhamnose 3,5-epimerase